MKLDIPEGLGHVTPVVKSGWEISMEKSGSGEQKTVESITWSGGSVPAGFREDFSFSAQAPADAGELQWKAYQTYENGTTVNWDLGSDEQHTNEDGSPDLSSSGPFSVTNVVSEADNSGNAAVSDAEQAAADAKTSASRSLYVAIAGVVLGLIGIALATRKK